MKTTVLFIVTISAIVFGDNDGRFRLFGVAVHDGKIDRRRWIVRDFNLRTFSSRWISVLLTDRLGTIGTTGRRFVVRHGSMGSTSMSMRCIMV